MRQAIGRRLSKNADTLEIETYFIVKGLTYITELYNTC